MRLMRTPGRAVLGLTTITVLLTSALVAPATAATPQARSSADWLVTQLDDGLVESEYQDDSGWQSYTDFGLSLDFFYAFDSLEVRAGKRAAILDAIEPRAGEYTDSYGTTYAGAVGKLLTAVQTQGIDPAAYGDGTLLPRLEELVVDAGPEQGRAKDDPATPDSSNSFGQSYVVTALGAAGSDETAAALDFLVDQQCSPGFFRESMNSADFTCDGGTSEQSSPSVDATATAAIALRSVIGELPEPLEEQARTAAREATRWLVTQQVRSGTFVEGRNTNSTGLAAAALADSGRTTAARKAARWVNRFRVTPRMARATELKRRDVGAVAFDGAALRTAKQRGLQRSERYVWRRSTAQAAPALDAL